MIQRVCREPVYLCGAPLTRPWDKRHCGRLSTERDRHLLKDVDVMFVGTLAFSFSGLLVWQDNTQLMWLRKINQ